MTLQHAAFAALGLYSISLIWLALRLRRGKAASAAATLFKFIGLLAICAHAVFVYKQLSLDQGINFSLMAMSNLVAWFVCAITVLNSFRQPLSTVLVILYPITIGMIVWTLSGDPKPVLRTGYSAGLIFHILSSILAYSVLSIAAAQALVLILQEKRLRQHKLQGLLRVLPPMQTMEQMLFELIFLGTASLSIAIVSGAIYVDNLFAQHLIHKTVFTLAAWGLFVILLWGRAKLGWRAGTAARWTLSGFACLALGFVGTKVVLEYLIA